jgi:benzoyl-CoA reductase subunit C
MVVSSQLVDKEEHSSLVARVLEELPARRLVGEPGARLMIVGSEDDDTEFVRMVESLGATIVTDEHCTGSRYFWEEVKEGSDPLIAIAERYVDRIPCPSKDWPERRRFPHIFKLIEDYNVQGLSSSNRSSATHTNATSHRLPGPLTNVASPPSSSNSM